MSATTTLTVGGSNYEIPVQSTVHIFDVGTSDEMAVVLYDGWMRVRIIRPDLAFEAPTRLAMILRKHFEGETC